MLERLSFEREIALVTAPRSDLALMRETDEGLRKKVKHLSLLPHQTVVGGVNVELTPAAADPGFYDGSNEYKIAKPLQDCLTAIIKRRKLRHMRVALVDLSGQKFSAPEFAGFRHKEQSFAASVSKIAAMLAAFQLRHDLQAAASSGSFAKIGDLFEKVRDDWVATHVDPGGTPASLGARFSKRGKLVLSGGARIGFRGVRIRRDRKGKITERKPIEVPKLPDLDRVIAPANHGNRLTAVLHSSGETPAELIALVTRFNKTGGGTDEFRDLGFVDRLVIAMGGSVPASNFAMETVIAELGFHYIASTLLQSGLFDPNRGGGLWLGADYQKIIWTGFPGAHPQSATAGSLAAFMTLLARGRLVSPEASAEMQRMIEKPPVLAPGTPSPFRDALSGLRRVLSKVGLKDGADELAFIDRDVQVDAAGPSPGTTVKKTIRLRYVVAALRAKDGTELQSLVRDLDRCIIANNGGQPGVGMQL